MADETLSPLSQELTKIPIEAVDETFLGKLDIASLEEFLGYMSILGKTLLVRTEWAAKWLEFKQKAADKAKRFRALPADESAALLAALPPEEAVEVKKAMEAAPAGDKPPTQNLVGSFVSSDTKVNPGQ